MSRSIATALAVLLLTACGGSSDGSTAVLEDNLAAQVEAQAALRDRVDELADRLEAVQSQDPVSDLRALQDQVATLSETVAAIQSGLGEAETSGEDLEARMGALDDQLGQLAETLSTLSSEVQRIGDQTEQLRQDLAQHVDDRDAHRRD